MYILPFLQTLLILRHQHGWIILALYPQLNVAGMHLARPTKVLRRSVAATLHQTVQRYVEIARNLNQILQLWNSGSGLPFLHRLTRYIQLVCQSFLGKILRNAKTGQLLMERQNNLSSCC